MEWNDRREGEGLKLFEPKPYYPQRGADKGPSMGVQGKLFRDPKPVDSARYPRGYTPERMREVRDWPIDVSGARPTSPKLKQVFEGKGGAHRILQTLARSTAPAKHFPQNDDMYNLHIEAGHQFPDAAGRYQGPATEDGRGRIKLDHHAITLGVGYKYQRRRSRQQEERAGQTLLHEVGHYVSNKIERNPSAEYGTPVQRGKEEARADDYEMEHFRPDPRDVRRGFSQPVDPTYEAEIVHQGIGGKKSFEAYAKARKTPLRRITKFGNVKTPGWAKEQRDRGLQTQLDGDVYKGPTAADFWHDRRTDA